MSDDLIKRSDAIKALKDNREYIDGDAYPFDCACDVIQAVPSADRPQGKWVFDDPVSADFKCSECLERQDICTAFCPCCGADMRESMKGADDE